MNTYGASGLRSSVVSNLVQRYGGKDVSPGTLEKAIEILSMPDIEQAKTKLKEASDEDRPVITGIVRNLAEALKAGSETEIGKGVDMLIREQLKITPMGKPLSSDELKQAPRAVTPQVYTRIEELMTDTSVTVRVKEANIEYHLRAVTCNESGKKLGYEYVVFLPSGFDPVLMNQVIQDLKVPREKILVTNERSDDVSMTIHQEEPVDKVVQMSTQYKASRAKGMVLSFLNSRGIVSEKIAAMNGEVAIAAEKNKLSYDLADLIGQVRPDSLVYDGRLEKGQVVFMEPKEWEKFVKVNSPFGISSSENIDGLTITKPPMIGINKNNHTIGTVVHEFFHFLGHPNLDDPKYKLQPGLVEGMTEFFALKAMGSDVRYSKELPVYKDQTRFVEMAISLGVVSEQELVNAYFLGEMKPIENLVLFFRDFSRIYESNEVFQSPKVWTALKEKAAKYTEKI